MRGAAPPAAGARLALIALALAAPALAQPHPRAAQPERPTIATHAYAVAPGHLEIETGGEWDFNAGPNSVMMPVFFKFGVTRRLQLGIQPTLLAPPGDGVAAGDASLALKYQLTSGAPLLADAAVVLGAKLATGRGSRTTGTTDASIMLVSSRQIGAISLDLNVGYTRRSGDGSIVPRTATLLTAAAGWPVTGPLGFTVELYNYPGTSGPAGTAPVVALLGGPTLRVQPALVLDAGVIVRVAGPQPYALYGGLTGNVGRITP